MHNGVAEPNAGRVPLSRQDLVRAALLSVAAGLIYVLFHLKGNTTLTEVYSNSAFGWMVFFWNYTQGFGGANYTQGWLIPMVSLWFVWRRRKELAACTREVSLAGLGVVVLALLLHWIGAKSQQTRLSLFAFIVLVWGIPFYLYGWAVARRLIFPAAFLIFCIPLNFFDSVLFPLRIASVRLAAVLLNGLGLDVASSGSAMYLPTEGGFSFDTADPACSIRMVLAIAAFTAAWACVRQKTLFRQWLLFAFFLPAALLGNTVRCIAVSLAAESVGPSVGRALLAHGSSAITYGSAIALLLLAEKALRHLKTFERSP